MLRHKRSCGCPGQRECEGGVLHPRPQGSRGGRFVQEGAIVALPRYLLCYIVLEGTSACGTCAPISRAGSYSPRKTPHESAVVIGEDQRSAYSRVGVLCWLGPVLDHMQPP